MDDYKTSSHYLEGSSAGVSISVTPESVVREHDVRVPMRDGVHLGANIYRPKTPGRYPVILSTSPYGKDQVDGGLRNKEIPNFHTGSYATSDTTAWEAPDPAYWVEQDYVVVHADTRGQGSSEGISAPWGPIAPIDYYDLIEWAAEQEWSDGNVGLCGVSYLAISQWKVAALHPPHLKAIVPWEGWTDPYDFHFFGGIPERGMPGLVQAMWIDNMRNPASEGDPLDHPDEAFKHVLRDEHWQVRDIDIEAITIPTLVCSSFSDQGLHTPDGFHAFRRLGSEQKWLYNHRRLKWEVFYGEQDFQRRFFDHFLKGLDTGITETPRVHVEINQDRTTFKVKAAETWPLTETLYRSVYLNAAAGSLEAEKVPEVSEVRYASDGSERATFDLIFDQDTDVVGHAKVRLWVAAEDADDIDLFIGVQKIDASGDQVFFFGNTGSNANDLVSRGWLRVSHRELDTERSKPWLPVLAHRREQKLNPGQIVPVEIEILPSGTTFLAGERLRLVIQGETILPGAPWVHFDTINRGRTILYTGGDYDAELMLPILPA